MDLHTIVDRLVQKAVAPIMQSISSLHQLGDRVEQLEDDMQAGLAEIARLGNEVARQGSLERAQTLRTDFSVQNITTRLQA